MRRTATARARSAAPWSPWDELSRHPQIWVHRCRLDEGQGWWCPGEQVILLDDRLGRREARCVLAHELGHVALGHCGLPDVAGAERLAVRTETQADRWAARRLVPLRSLARTLRLFPDDAPAAAAELDVTTDVLQVRLASLTDAERTVLSRPRGARPR